MVVDVGDYHLHGRGSSSGAKTAAAHFKISLARRNSRFSRTLDRLETIGRTCAIVISAGSQSVAAWVAGGLEPPPVTFDKR